MPSPPPASPGRLQRRLGVADAVVIGVGSMVGAGVFTAWGPAASAAGVWLLVGLVLAGFVAFCNAASSAQLAAHHPESGGTYVYARERLSPAWGHLAGWGFVVGKTASCAAMALGVGAYVWPEQDRLVAVLAVVGIVAVNLLGLSRTVAVTRVLLVLTAATLVLVVAAGWGGASPEVPSFTADAVDPWGILRSAGLLFFAFAGYARIATLGEEVRDPEHTIPKAVPRALGAVLVLYAVIGVTVLAVVPVEQLAGSTAPLRAVVEIAGWDAVGGVVRVGAGIAALGVLLNLIPGVSRTVLAMSRRRELPAALAHISPRRSTPARAEVLVGLTVAVLVLTIELRSAIAVSGVGVLLYYLLTNASALRLSADERRWPRWIAWAGAVGCAVLVAALPPVALAGGAAVIAAGVIVRRATLARSGGTVA